MDWTNIQYMEEVIRKQCKFANVRFENIDFDSQSWFQDVAWTTKQQNSFEIWLLFLSSMK